MVSGNEIVQVIIASIQINFELAQLIISSTQLIVGTCCSCIQSFAVIAALFFAIVQINKIREQQKQSGEHSRIGLSIQENWFQFDRYEKLPPAIPSWKELSDSGWAWRVLHLNHLNLLKMAWKEYSMGLISKDEFDGWVAKTEYRFRGFWINSDLGELQEGKEVLRQLLIPEEGFSKEFIEYLVKANIIPKEFVPK